MGSGPSRGVPIIGSADVSFFMNISIGRISQYACNIFINRIMVLITFLSNLVVARKPYLA